MSRKVFVTLTGLTIVLAIIVSGCGSSTSLSLNFSPEDSTSYKSVSEIVKDFRFEQPNLDKLREEQTKTTVEMDFTQTIQSVDAEGNATAKITIDSLAINIINKNENRFSFDSSKDKAGPMGKLLGQSYQIQIAPNGTVKVLEAEQAASAVTASYEKKIIKNILDEVNIVQRHEVAALPKDTVPKLKAGKSWNQVIPSPPGLLAPKSYKKTYTLSKVSGGVATVEMVAAEDAEPVKGSSGTGMGMFAKMFDNEDDYTGSMVIDTDTGTVLSSEETLVSTYLAQEMPEKGDPAKGPDTLTMQFTHKVKLVKLD